jgi:Orsellinic acid/F9775 biosynthesis cluster protein D
MLICTRCQYALVTTAIAAHLKTAHKAELTREDIQSCVRICKTFAIQAPKLVQMLELPLDTPPISHLRLYLDGIRCDLCPESRPYICQGHKGMSDHLHDKHQWENPRGKGGRPSKAAKLADTDFYKVTTSPVFCQTFHRSNFFRFFQVAQPKPSTNPNRLTALGQEAARRQPVSIQDQIEQQLTERLQAIDSTQSASLQAPRPYEVSSWLEMTQWNKHLRGQDLSSAARLIDLPLRSSPSLPDRCLSHLLASFDRLIEQARESIQQDKINIFDQHWINSFLRRRTSDWPIVFKLKGGTYKAYKDVGKRLICFIYRMVHLCQPPLLHCALTPAQSTAFDCMIHTGQAILRNEERQTLSHGSSQRDHSSLIWANKEEEEDLQYLPAIQQSLDRACLEFWIALLDHQLFGNIYDSALVGFLAVLGIDEENGRFYDAACYTSHLSAIIKMAQMLVIQRAVVAAEAGETEFPAQALEEMQDRFMVYGSRSLINWAQKLRTYGKKIWDSTTSLGFIIWLDDGQHLSYKDFELDMAQLKLFASTQVELAQAQSQELLLIHPDEVREDVVPALSLHSLKDDPTISQNGWSFLQDPRNGQLHGKDRWLLN